jgi:RND family efflux transporter MFP subunit
MQPRHFALIAVLFAVASVSPQHAIKAQDQSPGSQIESRIQAENCIVQYIEKVPIPARADGSLIKLNFKEGDTVNKDDVLAVIDARAAELAIDLKKAELKEAMLNAANDINIRNARNSAKLAKAEAESFKELRKEGAIPFWEMKKKEFEADRADLAIELAEMNTKIAEVQMIAKRSELEMAEFDLTRRKVLAPLTGHIEERIAQTGQWVQPGEPIATLIQMDQLRVEGDVDALRYPGQVRKGAPVEVLVYTETDRTIKFNGKLGYVSLEINSNDEYRVWVEVANKKVGEDWLLKPGMKAEIVIQKTAQGI